jgi:hypothetical protein
VRANAPISRINTNQVIQPQRTPRTQRKEGTLGDGGDRSDACLAASAKDFPSTTPSVQKGSLTPFGIKNLDIVLLQQMPERSIGNLE